MVIACYADDTSAVVGAQSPRENIQKAKITLAKLGEWFSANKLSLSPTKCKYALMSKNLKTATWKTDLEIYGKKLTEIRENTSSEDNPLVGLKVNEHLSYKIHVRFVAGKLRSGMFALRANKHLPNSAKKNHILCMCTQPPKLCRPNPWHSSRQFHSSNSKNPRQGHQNPKQC